MAYKISSPQKPGRSYAFKMFERQKGENGKIPILQVCGHDTRGRPVPGPLKPVDAVKGSPGAHKDWPESIEMTGPEWEERVKSPFLAAEVKAGRLLAERI